MWPAPAVGWQGIAAGGQAEREKLLKEERASLQKPNVDSSCGWKSGEGGEQVCSRAGAHAAKLPALPPRALHRAQPAHQPRAAPYQAGILAPLCITQVRSAHLQVVKPLNLGGVVLEGEGLWGDRPQGSGTAGKGTAREGSARGPAFGSCCTHAWAAALRGAATVHTTWWGIKRPLHIGGSQSLESRHGALQLYLPGSCRVTRHGHCRQPPAAQSHTPSAGSAIHSWSIQR